MFTFNKTGWPFIVEEEIRTCKNYVRTYPSHKHVYFSHVYVYTLLIYYGVSAMQCCILLLNKISGKKGEKLLWKYKGNPQFQILRFFTWNPNFSVCFQIKFLDFRTFLYEIHTIRTFLALFFWKSVHFCTEWSPFIIQILGALNIIYSIQWSSYLLHYLT